MQLKTLLNPSTRSKLAVLHFVIAALYMWFAASYQLTNKEFSSLTPDFMAYYTTAQLAVEHANRYDHEIFKEKQAPIIQEQGHINKPSQVLAIYQPAAAAIFIIALQQRNASIVMQQALFFISGSALYHHARGNLVSPTA